MYDTCVNTEAVEKVREQLWDRCFPPSWVLGIKLGSSGLCGKLFSSSQLWPCVKYHSHFIGVEIDRKLPAAIGYTLEASPVF